MNSIVFDMQNRDRAARWYIGTTKVDRDSGLWAKGGQQIEVALTPGQSQMLLPVSVAVWALESNPWICVCGGERGVRHSRCKTCEFCDGQERIATAVDSIHVSCFKPHFAPEEVLVAVIEPLSLHTDNPASGKSWDFVMMEIFSYLGLI